MTENDGLVPDFRAFFEAVPSPCVVLRPDDGRFTIVAANDSFLRLVPTTREEFLGRGHFEAFPENPDTPHADGERNLRASFGRVLSTKAPDRMALQRYDVVG